MSAHVRMGSRGREERPHRPRLTGQLLFGVALATVGVLFTLDNLDLVYAWDYLQYWPALLVVVGVSQLWSARTMAKTVSGLIWVLIGSVLLGDALNLISASLWDFWPIVLIVLGASIAWQSFFRPPGQVDADPRALVSGVAVMSGFERKMVSREFRGGELTAVMGGCKVDLRQATLVDGKAALNVVAVMGGIHLLVPETWRVTNDVATFMGGAEDKTTTPLEDDAPQLVLTGFAVMGGVEVRN